jgi:hypothetical protein
MTAQAALFVDSLDEGFYVKGTTDVAQARAVLAVWLYREGYAGTAEEGFDMAARMHPEAGLHRKNPCNCGYDHRWDLWPTNKPGHGAFPSVVFW